MLETSKILDFEELKNKKASKQRTVKPVLYRLSWHTHDTCILLNWQISNLKFAIMFWGWRINEYGYIFFYKHRCICAFAVLEINWLWFESLVKYRSKYSHLIKMQGRGCYKKTEMLVQAFFPTKSYEFFMMI